MNYPGIPAKLNVLILTSYTKIQHQHSIVTGREGSSRNDSSSDRSAQETSLDDHSKKQLSWGSQGNYTSCLVGMEVVACCTQRISW